mmetsp:Transcript_20128/g.50804  ORF Transcript_20128/g.50804 Transcript_20128/m.50804 type:complete len:226 (+) Transcript_20128:2467-3144(+)
MCRNRLWKDLMRTSVPISHHNPVKTPTDRGGLVTGSVAVNVADKKFLLLAVRAVCKFPIPISLVAQLVHRVRCVVLFGSYYYPFEEARRCFSVDAPLFPPLSMGLAPHATVFRAPQIPTVRRVEKEELVVPISVATTVRGLLPEIETFPELRFVNLLGLRRWADAAVVTDLQPPTEHAPDKQALVDRTDGLRVGGGVPVVGVRGAAEVIHLCEGSESHRGKRAHF